MRSFVVTLLVTIVVVIGVGFYLGWFGVSSTDSASETDVNITIDKAKMEEDTRKASEKAEEVGAAITERAKEMGSEISEKAKEIGGTISEETENAADEVTQKTKQAGVQATETTQKTVEEAVEQHQETAGPTEPSSDTGVTSEEKAAQQHLLPVSCDWFLKERYWI